MTEAADGVSDRATVRYGALMGWIKSVRWGIVGLAAIVGVTGGVVAVSAATAQPVPTVVVVDSDPARDAVRIQREAQRVADAAAAEAAAEEAAAEAAAAEAVAAAGIEAARVAAEEQAAADARDTAQIAVDAQDTAQPAADAQNAQLPSVGESLPDPRLEWAPRATVGWVSDMNPDDPGAGHWDSIVCPGGATATGFGLDGLPCD